MRLFVVSAAHAVLFSLIFGLLSQPSVSAETLERDFTLQRPLFSAESPWNQKASGAVVLPESDSQILHLYRVLLGDKTWLHPTGYGMDSPWPFMFVNFDEYSVPIARMGQGLGSIPIRDYETIPGWTNSKIPISNAGGPVTIPQPGGKVRPSGPENTGADGHLVLYDPTTLTEWDFWQTTTAYGPGGKSLGGGRTGNTIYEVGMADFFDLRGQGTNPKGDWSARATGTPLLAGLLLPEDIESGSIDHALSLAIPGTRNTNTANPFEPNKGDYFYPAATTETDFFSSSPDALASGQRIRLKSALVVDGGYPLDENLLSPLTRMFLKALREYGAYVVDGAEGLTFSAEDIHTAHVNLTDDQINTLIGSPAGTPLPAGKTK